VVIVLLAGMGNSIYPLLRRLTTFVVCLAAVDCAFNDVVAQRHLRGPDDLVAAINSPPGEASVVFVPLEAADVASFHLPKSSFKRIADRALQTQTSDLGVMAFIQSRGVPNDAAAVLVTSFNETEQSRARHALAACLTAPDKMPDVQIYAESSDNSVLRDARVDLTLADALATASSSGSHAAVLVREAIPRPAVPVWQGKQEWFWYVFP
jgi:hypothetical protein